MKAKVERDIESKLHLYIKKDDTLHQKKSWYLRDNSTR